MKSKKEIANKIKPSRGVDFVAIVTAQKWGNSLGIRIPKEAAEQIGIEQGSELILSVNGNESTIVLKPQKARKKYKLEELLSQITPENRHETIDFGSEGRELM